jgi:hypothetical protein
MNHSLFAAFGALVVAGSLTLSAQTPTTPAPRPQTPTTPSPSTPARTDDKTMTVTGCLKAGDAATADGPTSRGTASGATFKLTNVVEDATSTNRPSASTPGAATPGAMSTSSAGKQYMLTADSGVNLSAHVNHQVRVTGKMSETADHSRETTSTPAAPGARPTDPAEPGSTVRPGETPTTRDHMTMDKASSTIAVSSVTMISSSCPGATQ